MAMPALEGIPITLLKFREHAAVGVMTWGTLLSVVPDPVREETPGALRNDRHLRQHAQLRAEVQRVLKGTQKGRNVKDYAAYIAAGLRGDYGDAWSTPPLCLWSRRSLHVSPGGQASLVLGDPIIAIDAETQVAAMHKIWNDPDNDAFKLDESDLRSHRVAFEIYWDIEIGDARQIFHDRNLRGVAVPKALALSMDQRDLGTTIAQRSIAVTEVKVDGKSVALSKFVNTRKRQLGKADPEWITLSSLRSLVVTALLGTAGIEGTSGTIEPDDLPDAISGEKAAEEVADLVSLLMRTFTSQFAERSAITAPAVLAGIGAAAYRTMSWATEQSKLTRDQLMALLGEIKWEREARYWEGVAAKHTEKGGLSFAGGAKDSGHRVCDAILKPESDLGKKIRGCE